MHTPLLLCLLALGIDDPAVIPSGVPQAAQTNAGPAAADPHGTQEALSADDWSGIRAAYETGTRTVKAAPDALRARHRTQRWTSAFDGRGVAVAPDAAGWTWGLVLERWGFDGALREIDGVAAGCAEGERVEYGWDASLTEWYVNGAGGLEHGYTVHRRPEGEGPLAFELAVHGSLNTRTDADGRGARFEDASGAIVLSYAGLVAFDATGRTLDARLSARDGGLRIEVDERDARYPLTIDPTVQQAYLTASNADWWDEFGTSIAVSGDTVVVGAPNEDSTSTAVDVGPWDNYSVDAGAAYVFVRNGTAWTRQAYLKPSETNMWVEFGRSVAVSGETVVVGAPGARGLNAAESGAAYVFVRSGTTWSQQACLRGPNTDQGDSLGYSVAICGDTVVIGAPFEDSNSTTIDAGAGDNSAVDAGAAYVFVRYGTTWSRQAYLKASNAGTGDLFGYSVGLSGDTAVVGARFEESNSTTIDMGQADNSLPQAGAAYVFVRNGQAWRQQAYLKASNTDSHDSFGDSVAVDGDTAVVGAHTEHSNSSSIGAGESDNSAPVAGAAYVFVRNGVSWSQQAYLKASNTDEGDYFGYSVAVSGGTVAVGAYREDSNSTVIGMGEGDNSAEAAGAVYVFVRSGTTWSRRLYLKASNARGGDSFGYSVAMSADTVVVGAPSKSINDLTSDAGAAYVFSLPKFPASYCFGDGSSAPCPCSPVPVPHGAANRGCPSNLFPAGATASAMGDSSLSADMLVLIGHDMVNGSMIFYQGATQQSGGAGIAFGDGKRCIQPTAIRRFAPTPVVGNTASYPGPGDPPISLAGAIGAPGVRHYQGWYRSADPTFCTPSTFNMTNALTITWEL